jgi:gliding motility-associated-like protein
MNNDTETSTPIEHINKVSLLKTLTNTGPFKLGDEINYSFEISNEGTTTLSSVLLVDNKLPNSPVYVDGDGNGNSKLDVGEIWSYTGTYRVKQTDVNFGKVSNIATVYTKDPKGVEVSDISGNNVPTVAYLGEGKITLVKEVDTLLTKTPFVLNDSIIYKFTMTNIGEVPLNTIVLTDLKFALSSPPVYKSGDANKNNILDKTETWVFRGKYYVSQNDVDAGRVVNSALVTSKYDNGLEIKAASDSSGTKANTDDPTITPIENRTRIALIKSVTNGSKFKIGQEITYLFTVKNLGTVTLRDVAITDLKIDAPAVYLSGDNNSNNILDPNESWSFSGKHTVTIADAKAGIFENSATVLSHDYFGNNVTDISGAENDTDLPTTSIVENTTNITLVKSIANANLSPFKIGQVINYNFVVQNLGALSLDSVVLKDDLIDHAALYISGDVNSNKLLDSGESWLYTGSHTVTQTDVVAGFFNNTATATATNILGNKVSDISGTLDTNDLPTPATIDQGPIATDDTAYINQTPSITIDIHANDIQGGSPIVVSTVMIVGQPTNGNATVVNGSVILYTPNKGFSGNDTFTYKVQDEKGNWSNVAIVTVTVSPNKLVIPNAFSPNGDGVNDSFEIRGLGNFDLAKFEVYNRWGNQVYRNENYQNDWTAFGLNDGTYYYLLYLTVGGKTSRYDGWILIQR